jgi:hypothetical protein
MRAFRAAAALAVAVALNSCVDPNAQARTAQAIIDMETQFGGMQQDIQTLINSVDSLRAVVAYQDTLISRLATLTNVPWPPPRR